MSHRVAVVAPRNLYTLFQVGVALEVFAMPPPEVDEEWYQVQVCTARPGRRPAITDLLTAEIVHGVEAIDAADTVVLVGVDSFDRPAEERVLDALRRAHDRGARLVSFCTGAFVLAAAGLLDGRPATTHWRYADLLARSYPAVDVDPDVLYVDDGTVLTSAGAAAAVDLSLHIVRRDFGARVARHVAREMVVSPHREGGQAQFVMTPVPDPSGTPDGVQRAMEHVTGHLEQPFTLQQMAALAFMSTRNFSRRFRETTGTTPSRWLLHQRLSRARELLEETDRPVEWIAQSAGFGSAVTMRQRFVQELQTSPTAYRRAFRGTATDAPARPTPLAS